MFFGKDKAKQKALDNLQLTYEKVGASFKMNHHDFPPVEEYRTFLSKFDIELFPELEKVEKEGLLAAIRNCADTVLPRMLRPVKQTTLLDPRSKEQRQNLQSLYMNQVREQFEGKQGIQGSSDVAMNSLRQSAVQGAPQSPVAAGGVQPQPQMSGAFPAVPPDQMAIMMQMMQQMMMQQQQQQLAPQGSTVFSSAPPPQQQT